METAESKAAKASDAKIGMARTTDPIVDSLWAAAIRYLSWTSLWITAATMLIGAACLALISWSSPIANWFRGGLRFRATQFVCYKCFRKFPWINVRSGSDIISGRLQFYDVNPQDSAAPPTDRTVQNVTDLDAIVPLIAHVEYWKNPTVWSRLFAAVTS